MSAVVVDPFITMVSCGAGDWDGDASRVLTGFHATRDRPLLEPAVDLHMPHLGGADRQLVLSSAPVEDEVEIAQAVRTARAGAEPGARDGIALSIRRARDTGICALSLRVEFGTRGRDIARAAEEGYAHLFLALGLLGDVRPLRIWNTMPRINAGADRLGQGPNETYKRFNGGRRRAWQAYDSDPRLRSTCAATGIGNFDPEPAITIVALATPHEVVNIENPKQISFLDYARRFGMPPSSRRATIHLLPHGIEVYVAGTASIVGQENRFCGDHEPNDVHKQTRQTLENIAELIGPANLGCELRASGLSRGAVVPGYSPHDLRAVRVYVRDPGRNLEAVRETVEGEFGLDPRRVMYVAAEICRRPLDVEIDGYVAAGA